MDYPSLLRIPRSALMGRPHLNLLPCSATCCGPATKVSTISVHQRPPLFVELYSPCLKQPLRPARAPVDACICVEYDACEGSESTAGSGVAGLFVDPLFVKK